MQTSGLCGLRAVAVQLLAARPQGVFERARYLHPQKKSLSNTVLGSLTSDLQHDAVDCAYKQNEEPFPFLRFPAEIRNLIYRALYPRGKPRLLEQPAITRVNRQVRAEALAVYYRKPAVLLIEARDPVDWVLFMYRIIGSFGGTSYTLASSNTFRYVKGLELHLTMPDRDGVHLIVDLMADPNDWMQPFPDNTYWRIVIGSPGMDWTDETAVQTACDEAAIQLKNNLRERRARLLEGEEKPPSGAWAQNGALEAMRVLASVCPPHLTKAVCIFDISEDELDGCWGALGRS